MLAEVRGQRCAWERCAHGKVFGVILYQEGSEEEDGDSSELEEEEDTDEGEEDSEDEEEEEEMCLPGMDGKEEVSETCLSIWI